MAGTKQFLTFSQQVEYKQLQDNVENSCVTGFLPTCNFSRKLLLHLVFPNLRGPRNIRIITDIFSFTFRLQFERTVV